MKIMNLIAILALALLTSCTWVKPTDSGQHVQLSNESQISQCKKIGKTTVSVLDRVGFVSRSEDLIAKELSTLARNSGASMGGDTVVPADAPSNGEQSFDVYQCGQ